MFKPANLTVVAIMSSVLAACGGTASSTPSGGVQASLNAGSAAAKASASVAAPAGGAASAGAVPSAAVVGPKAPGPYSANGSATVSGGQATMEGTDALKWQPNTLVAKAGDKVTLQVKNGGATAHNFISPGLNVTATDVPTAKTVAVSFTAPTAPGAYQFWCNIPGHAEAGMVGEVIVQ